MFMVTGGVFTDMSFSEIVPGTAEVYGPFQTRDEAVAVWRGKMGYQIDTCEHRLFVTGARWGGGRYVPDTGEISACDKCGAEYPSAPLGTIHKCGRCSGGYCKRKVVN